MFTTKTRDSRETAYHYLCGLLQGEKRNMERMEEAVPASNYQALQQFITNSPWDDREVMDEVARRANELLGGRRRAR
jgi:SRSO17 transposase